MELKDLFYTAISVKINPRHLLIQTNMINRHQKLKLHIDLHNAQKDKYYKLSSETVD